MMVLITYDAQTQTEAGKRRLRQMAKLYENHGQRVRFAVFECLLGPSLWLQLKAKLLAAIDPASDSLRSTFSELNGSDASSTSAPKPGTTPKSRSSSSANLKRTIRIREVRASAKHKDLIGNPCLSRNLQSTQVTSIANSHGHLQDNRGVILQASRPARARGLKQGHPLPFR